MMKLGTIRRAGLACVAAGLCLLAGATGPAEGQAAPPPVPVTVARATPGSVEATKTATGTVVSRNDARLAAEIAGRLTWVAEPGSAVRRGAVLARIDTTMLELQLREDEAQVRRLAANVGLLETQLERLETLGEGIASRSQIDEAAARLAMARQEHEQARVARDRTRHDIERAVLRAPVPGYVVERLHQLGEFVAPGVEVLRLTDTESVEVVARAPVAEAMHLAAGREVRVAGAGSTEASRIRAVVPVGDERSRMLELRIELPGGRWPIGSAVRVELPAAASSSGVVVPRDAVIIRADGAHVFRVGRDDVAERVPVQLGNGDATRVEVLRGLSGGDRVVVRGGERLNAGQPVKVASAPASATMS